MSISPADILVPDTSVVVDLARNNRSGQAILETYSLRSRTDRPLISVITTAMGQQNDMWIAATAKVAGAVLLTGDSGFSWLNPQFIRVEYISRAS